MTCHICGQTGIFNTIICQEIRVGYRLWKQYNRTAALSWYTTFWGYHRPYRLLVIGFPLSDRQKINTGASLLTKICVVKIGIVFGQALEQPKWLIKWGRASGRCRY